MPAKNRRQQRALFAKFGEQWVHDHHYDKLAVVKIGWTGTEDGMTEGQSEAVRRDLGQLFETYSVAEFHHGECEGADFQFERILLNGRLRQLWADASFTIVGHPGVTKDGRVWKRAPCDPDERRPEKGFLDRNKDIVLEGVDELWAAPKEFEMILRSGVWATVRRAEKADRDIRVFWPDGSVTREWTKP